MSPKVTQIEFFELNGGCHRILRQIPGRKALLLFTWASDFCLEFVKKQTQASKMACFLAFVLLLSSSFFLSSPKVGWRRNGEFFGQNGGCHRILRKILGRNTFKIFSKKIFFASPGKFSLFKDILSLFREG